MNRVLRNHQWEMTQTTMEAVFATMDAWLKEQPTEEEYDPELHEKIDENLDARIALDRMREEYEGLRKIVGNHLL